MDDQKLQELKKKFGLLDRKDSEEIGESRKEEHNSHNSQVISEEILEVQRAIERDLPGYRLSEESFEQMNGHRTPAIEELKKAVKSSLPGWHLSPNYIEKNQLLQKLEKNHSIIVRLNNDSVEKMAQYKKGRVEIIQG